MRRRGKKTKMKIINMKKEKKKNEKKRKKKKTGDRNFVNLRLNE